MVHAHELLKQEKKNAKVAIEALSADPSNVSSERQAEKTHRRMKKVDDKSAEDYFKKAQTVYPYSIYFEGAKKDT